MHKEELVEEGIVTESKNGIATILISDSDHCNECTAKIYCKPGNSKERSLIVKDPFGVNPGDKVRVSIPGGRILTASFLLYGIPLILLVSGIFIGFQLFEYNRELFSTLLALGMLTVYALGLFLYARNHKYETSSYPRIVFVSHPGPRL